MFIASFVVGDWQTNCYVITAQDPQSGGEIPAVVIDPGVDSYRPVTDYCAENNLKIEAVVCTHGHFDHVANAAQLADEHHVPVWIHASDEIMLTEPLAGLGQDMAWLVHQVLGSYTMTAPQDVRYLTDGQHLTVANITFNVTHLPGHSPGCVVLTSGDLCLSGDVVFAGSIGRTDLPGSDPKAMLSSLKRFSETIPSQASILPGHGPATTMANELATNPFLSKEFLN